MNPLKKALLSLICLTQLSGTASANPIAMVRRLYAELTGRTHVRLRFTGNRTGHPDDVTTFGRSHSEWFTTDEGVSENTGSGVETMVFQYMCDCFVPTGSPLTYTSPSASIISTYYAESMTFTVTPYPMRTTLCDDKCPALDTADAGQTPATGGTSGNASSGEASASGGSLATSGAAGGGESGTSELASSSAGSVATSSAANSDNSANNDKQGGACSFSSHGGAGALSLLLALGLVALSWRRRR